jgi:hypothetical protein
LFFVSARENKRRALTKNKWPLIASSRAFAVKPENQTFSAVATGTESSPWCEGKPYRLVRGETESSAANTRNFLFQRKFPKMPASERKNTGNVASQFDQARHLLLKGAFMPPML